MNNDLPLIIIDFDGVINPLAQMDWEAVWPDMSDSSFRDDDGFATPVRYSPTVVNFFTELTKRAEVVWLTTWKADTKFFPTAFGFPAIPWLDEISGPYHDGWWKTDVIASLPRGRRILWIDDEIPREESSPEQQLIASFNGMLLHIVPTLSIGLTPEHLEQIEEFVQG